MKTHTAIHTAALLCASGLLALAAFHCRAADAGVPLGHYRVVLTLPGGELPFGLELKREGATTVAYLLNAQERLRCSDVSIKGSHVEIHMPGFMNRIIADASDGSLKGELERIRPGAELQHIPLSAHLGDRYRFFPAPAPKNATVAGRWAVVRCPVGVGVGDQHGDAGGVYALDLGQQVRVRRGVRRSENC